MMFTTISLGLPAGGAVQTVALGDQFSPRLLLEEVFTRDAAQRALFGAFEWLANPKCQAVFSEFRDERGRPLTELGASPQSYLGLVLFRNAGERGKCVGTGIVAFTMPSSRVVYRCGRDFERAWRRCAQWCRPH